MLSAWQTIHMKCQDLFSMKNIYIYIKNLENRLLQILLGGTHLLQILYGGALRVNIFTKVKQLHDQHKEAICDINFIQQQYD